MTDADTRLAERFAALRTHENGDWANVRKRARRRAARRGLIAIAAAFGAVAVAAPALGLQHTVIDLFSSEPAPERIQVDFARMRARAAIDVGPKIVPVGEAREVMAPSVDGIRRSFWVVATEAGGFCYRWHTFGSCGRISGLLEPKLGIGGQEGKYGSTFVLGHVLAPETENVQLRYRDGEQVELPFVWVSAPIDAGFFAFQVPEQQQRSGHGAEAVIALDGKGHMVERQVLPGPPDPRWEDGPDGLPRIADRTQKRTLFDFRDEAGQRWTLTIAPAPGERLCFSFNRGGGCRSPRVPDAAPLSVQGGDETGPAFICCTVADDVTQVALEFEDGESVELEPIEGFLLYTIPSAHYPRGHRLDAIVERDASGREVGRRKIATGTPALYPCRESEELHLGYGQNVCP